MDEKITIPYNDVFFYGLSLKSRDTSDVRGDIFSNIFMKYLRSLKPVTNRLYRTTENAKYEYSYVFVPSKPLSWRVIRNRRVVEDIEYLSDGKYCLSYYDDNGNDFKRVIYSSQHKWLKTNYYNTLYGSNLLCYLVPKEQNGETVIMQYITGEPYPVTLYCCPLASCSEVLNNILERVPEPEVMALTNYGLLYFACEETYNIYKQVHAEEEKKYSDAHKPAVFNTQEDVAGGFCFQIDSFDSTKSVEKVFDLSAADELTEDGFADVIESDANDEFNTEESVAVDSDVYSIEKEIAEAIRIISEETNISIDEGLVLPQNDSAVSEDTSEVLFDSEAQTDLSTEIPDISSDDEMIDVDNEYVAEELNSVILFDTHEEETTNLNHSDNASINDTETFDIQINTDDINLLTMDDDAIDDYVSSLIDSILLDAHTTASEYLIDKEDVFTQVDTEAVPLNDALPVGDGAKFIRENTPDASIESNGASYYYYGDTSDGKRSGIGRTLMADGKTAYEGEYKDDMRHGKGSFYYKDGSLCYWGDWKENLRNGFGIGLSSETGVAHIGSWNQNKPEGIGVRFDKDGNFMYLDSAAHRTNGGIRVTGFTENSLFVEFWDEQTLKIIKKEIFLDELLK